MIIDYSLYVVPGQGIATYYHYLYYLSMKWTEYVATYIDMNLKK